MSSKSLTLIPLKRKNRRGCFLRILKVLIKRLESAKPDFDKTLFARKSSFSVYREAGLVMDPATARRMTLGGLGVFQQDVVLCEAVRPHLELEPSVLVAGVL